MSQELHAVYRRMAADIAGQIGQAKWGTVTSVRATDTGYEAKVALQPEDMVTEWLPILSPMVGAGWGIVAPPATGMQAFVIPDSGDGAHGVVAGLTFSTQAMPPQPGGAPVKAGQFALVHENGSYLLFNDDDVVLVTNRDLLATIGRDLQAVTSRDVSVSAQGNARLAAHQDATISVGGTLTIEASHVNATGSASGSSIGLNAGTVVVNGQLLVSGDITDLGGAHGPVNLLRTDYNTHHHGSGGPPTPVTP